MKEEEVVVAVAQEVHHSSPYSHLGQPAPDHFRANRAQGYLSLDQYKSIGHLH